MTLFSCSLEITSKQEWKTEKQTLMKLGGICNNRAKYMRNGCQQQ